jgi:prepilin peptidase CpaA
LTLVAWVLLGLFWLLLAAAAISDLRSLRVPNSIVLATFGAAIALLFVRPEVGAWWQHPASFAIMLSAGMVLFNAGWVGGGDAKLAAAAAILFDLRELVWFVGATALAGGLLTVLLLGVRRLPLGDPHRRWLGLAIGRSIPNGVAIAVGAAAVSSGLTAAGV